MVEANTSLFGGAIWRAYDSRAELSRAVADLIADALAAGIERDGRACAALGGGVTPIPVYDRLAQAQIEWSKVTIAPTDERRAPPEHPARNDFMLRRTLGRGLASTARILALEDEDAISALPAFDIVLLGAGSDGHFASLFAGAPGLSAAMDPHGGAPVAALTPDPLPPEAPFARLTLTLARLLMSRRIALMITGAEKRAIALDAFTPGDPLVPPIRGLFAAAHVEVHWSA